MQGISRRLLMIIVFVGIVWNLMQAATARYRCMWRDDPATSMVIGWDQVAGSNPVLYYDVVDHGMDFGAYRMSKTPDQILAARGMSNHFVRLGGLKPNTVYYFIIKDSDGLSRPMSFKTAPDNPNARLSIIAGGDSRNHREARISANKLVGKLRPTVVLFNGDMTADDSAGAWRKWLDDWQHTIGTDGRLFPVIVARGNHEASNESLVEIFDVGNPGLVYALNFGGNLLRIYTLNSMIPSGGEQRDWLESDLRQHQDMTWRFAQYHHAIRPHTSGKPEKDELLIHWATLFHKYKVQLLIESDSHVAKWTYPIRPSNDRGSEQGFIRDDENGSVYIGEGCWGAPLRAVDDDKSWTRNSGSFNQFNWIFVDSEKVEVRTVMTDISDNVGEVSDRNIFEPPIGLSLWNPSNGDVLVISKDKPKPPPVVADAPPRKSSGSPASSQSLAGNMQPESNDDDDWSNQPKIQCDNSGNITFRYTLKQGCKVVALLLDEKFTVLSRLELGNQIAKTHLKELNLQNLKSGRYFLVIKGGENVVGKYQVIR